jgi:hypothetical protein
MVVEESGAVVVVVRVPSILLEREWCGYMYNFQSDGKGGAK